MRAKVWALSLLLFLTAVLPASAQTTTQSMKVFVDGKELNLSVKPLIFNNTTLVPMRDFFEAMGAKVTYFPVNKQIVGKKDNIEVVMHINYYPAFVNGEQVWLTQAPKEINGKTYVPLRFIGEVFGSEVNYNENWAIIDIRKKIIPKDVKEDEKKALETRVAWKKPFEYPFVSEPVADGKGNLLIPNGNKLYSLKSNGEENWEISLGVAGSADYPVQDLGVPVVSSDGKIYVGTSDIYKNMIYNRAVYQVLNQGEKGWYYTESTDYAGIDYRRPSNVSVGPNGVVYFVVKNRLNAIYSDGKRNWSYKNSSYEIATDPIAIEKDKVAFINKHNDGIFTVLNKDGKEDWKYRVHQGRIRSLSIDKENWKAYILVEGYDKSYLTALDLFDRLWLWSRPINGKNVKALQYDKESVYLATEVGLVGLDKNGNEKWTLKCDLSDTGLTMRPGKEIFAVTKENKIIAVNGNGLKEWEVTIQEPVSYVKVIQDSLLVGTKSGNLFSIKI